MMPVLPKLINIIHYLLTYKALVVVERAGVVLSLERGQRQCVEIGKQAFLALELKKQSGKR
jgi:hypothetical protein